MSDRQIVEAVTAFAASINQQPVGLAHHSPQEGLSHADCLANTTQFVEAYGGGVQFGWYFVLRTSEDPGSYLIAVNHVVWHNPEDGHLVNLTPFPADSDSQPMTSRGDLLFLLDDAARPFENGEVVAPLPRRFHSVGDNPQLRQFVADLQRQEYESYNRRFGADFRVPPA